MRAAVLLALVLATAACAREERRPLRLLDGRPAAEFRPVRGGVIASGRVLRLGDVDDCLSPADRADADANSAVVERVGVDDRSLTFANRSATGVYACDGGADASGERPGPWCASVFGEIVDGQLLDPRLDVLCRDRTGRPLAYAFVTPVKGAHWIGVRQDGYAELYEVLADLPVRVATARGVDLTDARATFDITQYDPAGNELVAAELDAAVAG